MSAGLERPSVMLLCRLNIYPLISSRFGFRYPTGAARKWRIPALILCLWWSLMRQLNKLISYQGTSSIWKCLTHWIDAFFYRIEANFEWPPTAKISFHRWWNFLRKTAKKFCVNPSIGSIQFIFCLRLVLRNRVYYHLTQHVLREQGALCMIYFPWLSKRITFQTDHYFCPSHPFLWKIPLHPFPIRFFSSSLILLHFCCRASLASVPTMDDIHTILDTLWWHPPSSSVSARGNPSYCRIPFLPNFADLP